MYLFHYLTFATLVMQYVNARNRPLLVWKQLQNVVLANRNHELCLHGAVRKQAFLHGWLVGVVGRRTWPRVMACAESERTESELATESQPENLTDTEINYV